MLSSLVLAAVLLSAPGAPAQVCTTGLIGIADCSNATLGQPMHHAGDRTSGALTGALTGATAGVTVGAAPAPAPSPAPRVRDTSPLPGVYSVRHGDTLSAIATRVNYPGGWKALARDNGYLNPNKIFVGQQIVVARV